MKPLKTEAEKYHFFLKKCHSKTKTIVRNWEDNESVYNRVEGCGPLAKAN